MAITSRDQIVNMNDVYKFYGKDKGIINTECSNFYSKAKSYIDLLTENDIMNVGDVGSGVLFEKLLEELDIFKDAINRYAEDRCSYFESLKTRQENEFQAYQAKVREKELAERSIRQANIG